MIGTPALRSSTIEDCKKLENWSINFCVSSSTVGTVILDRAVLVLVYTSELRRYQGIVNSSKNLTAFSNFSSRVITVCVSVPVAASRVMVTLGESTVNSCFVPGSAFKRSAAETTKLAEGKSTIDTSRTSSADKSPKSNPWITSAMSSAFPSKSKIGRFSPVDFDTRTRRGFFSSAFSNDNDTLSLIFFILGLLSQLIMSSGNILIEKSKNGFQHRLIVFIL